MNYGAVERLGGGQSEIEGVREHFSIYSPCAQRGGRLLFESACGADDDDSVLIMSRGAPTAAQRDGRTETHDKYMTCKLHTARVASRAITGEN